jgi:hypothetical protein
MDPNLVQPEELFSADRDSFAQFVEHVIGLDNEQFHNDIDDNLGNALHRKIVISFPRGHGKSTHLSVAFPLWLIAKNHNLRILLVSATGQVSKFFMSEIIAHIDRNELYQAFSAYIDPMQKGVVPRMKNYAKIRESWTGDSIVIARDQLNLKDPTINAVGLFGSILARRADVIICDDVVTQENSATEAQRLKVIDWMYTTVIPVLVPGGIFVYLGNTWHMDDLVARLLKDPQFDYRKRMPAIQSESTHPELWDQWAKLMTDEAFEKVERLARSQEFYLKNKVEMDDGVKVLWPSRYNYGWLWMERLSNPYAFARMYQCDPSDRPDQKFKESWLEAAMKKGAKLKLSTSTPTLYTTQIVTEGIDLAISEKDGSDDTARIVLDRVKFSSIDGVNPGDLVVRHIHRGKISPNQVKDLITDDFNNLKPDGIRVESVGYQDAIRRDLDDAGIPVRGYHTGGEKLDPYIGINSLAIYAEQGKLVLPYDQTDPGTIRLIAQLVNEMRAFPDGHTGDSLMALWFAFSEMRDLMGDRLVVPANNGNPLLKDPPDLNDPVVLKEEGDKADMNLSIEQRVAKQQFAEMMGQYWRP